MRSSLYPTDELRRRTHAWAVKLRVNPKWFACRRCDASGDHVPRGSDHAGAGLG